MPATPQFCNQARICLFSTDSAIFHVCFHFLSWRKIIRRKMNTYTTSCAGVRPGEYLRAVAKSKHQIV